MLRLHAVGENGHKVSQYFKSALPAAIFLDHSFPLDIHSAILRQTRIVETMLVADRDINTEFSGSTMSLCIILNGKIFATNMCLRACWTRPAASQDVDSEHEVRVGLPL